MHPGDDPGNLVTVVDFLHEGSNLVCSNCQILQYQRVRQNAALIQGIGHYLRISFNFRERFFSVQML
ncbi:hypothetical protein D3C80_1609800 [compost metagenome]